MNKGKKVSIALLTAALALVAAGCSSTQDSADSPATGAASDSSFPTTLAGKFGDVTVETKPQRVVAVGWGDAETALALGVQPVGASDWLAFGGEGVGPWAQGLYEQAPEIIATLEPSYESIAALQPDLILDTKSSGDKDRYDRLSQIAPTVGLPDGADNYTTTMEDQVELVAQAVGESDKGTELVTAIEKKFADAAAANPEFAGRTITVGAFSGTGYGAYISDSSRLQFMKKLGFVQNPTIDTLTPQGFSVPISREQLDLMDADMVVIFPINNPAVAVTDDELFQRIPAVQQGHSLVFSDPQIAKSYSANTILSLDYALETVVPQVADKLGA